MELRFPIGLAVDGGSADLERACGREPVAAALNEIFQRQRRVLMWSVMRIVGDAHLAEDLAQEAYLRVRRAMEARPIEHIEAFLHQTARNLALDHARRQRTRRGVEVDGCRDETLTDVVDPVPSQEATLIERERFELLRRTLAGLPPRAQQVVMLSRISEWSNRRIAAHLGVSERTVFNDLKIALAHCRDSLARYDRR